MNPYDEPNAKPENDTTNVSRWIDWVSIAMAMAVHVSVFVLAMMARTVTELKISEHWFARVFEVASIFVLPAAIAGLFLARRVHHRWIMHGVVYSLMMALLINGIVRFDSEADMLEIAVYRILWPLGTAVVILLSMAISRRLLKNPQMSATKRA